MCQALGPPTRHLFQHDGVLGWCRMGHVGGEGMPVVPQCLRSDHYFKILFHPSQMVRKKNGQIGQCTVFIKAEETDLSPCSLSPFLSP